MSAGRWRKVENKAERFEKEYVRCTEYSMINI